MSEPLPHDGGGVQAQRLQQKLRLVATVRNDEDEVVGSLTHEENIVSALVESAMHHLGVAVAVYRRQSIEDQVARLREIVQDDGLSDAQLRRELRQAQQDSMESLHRYVRAYLKRRLPTDVVLSLIPRETKEN